MVERLMIFLVAIGLATTAGAVHADMVILKSGEMYQTRRAWKQDDQVFLYRDGQVIHFSVSDVERVIHEPPPDNRRPSDDTPEIDASPPDPLSTTGGGPPATAEPFDDAGYHGFHWGMPPSQIEELKPVGTDPAYGSVQQYVRAKGGRRFGRARVDRIVLGFWQDGLYTIVVEVSNFLDFRELKSESFRRFGKGRQRRADVETYYWVDDHSDRLLAYDVDSDTGYLWMRSRILHDRVKARYPD